MAADDNPGTLLPAGTVVADRFAVLRQVARRATSCLFKTRDEQTGQLVALRVLDESLVRKAPDWALRVIKEAPLAHMLKGRHHEQLIDSGNTQKGLFYVATEFLRGRSLEQALADGRQESGRALTPAGMASILTQLSAALAEMHGMHVIHGRVRPAKIFLIANNLEGRDQVKLLDLTGRLRRSFSTPSNLVFLDAAAEMPYWCPEECQGEIATARSDIYTWGVIAYEVLTGNLPFEFTRPAQTLWAHVMQPPPPLQGVPDLLAALVLRALAKQPAQRFSDGATLNSALHTCLAELSWLTRGSTM